jgi:hypothetical protein
MGWNGLKSLGAPVLAAITTFLGILGGLLYTFGVDAAEGADTSAVFVWVLKGVAGVAIFASLASAGAAVDVLLPSGVRQSKWFSLSVAVMVIVVVVLAGWYAGSVASSLFDGDRSVGSNAYARRMSTVLGEIAHEQGDVIHRLRQVNSGVSQASVAADVSQSISHQAAAVRAIHVEGNERRATAAVAAAIDRLAHSYDALAVAAKDADGSQKALDRARRLVNRAGERLRTAEVALEDHGYEVVAIRRADADRLHTSS